MVENNIVNNLELESKELKNGEKEISPSELNRTINEVGYTLIHEINDIKKQQIALEEKLEKVEKKFDDFIDWLSEQIRIGWEQGWNMARVSKEYSLLLKKHRDISYVGLLDYWGTA